MKAMHEDDWLISCITNNCQNWRKIIGPASLASLWRAMRPDWIGRTSLHKGRLSLCWLRVVALHVFSLVWRFCDIMASFPIAEPCEEIDSEWVQPWLRCTRNTWYFGYYGWWIWMYLFCLQILYSGARFSIFLAIQKAKTKDYWLPRQTSMSK